MRFSLSVFTRVYCDMQISSEMVSNVHVHQLTVPLSALSAIIIILRLNCDILMQIL